MLLLFHWFTLGALAIMLGYMLFQYSIVKRKEYLFFSLYLFLTLTYFFTIIEFYGKANRTEYLIYHASYSTIPLLSFICFFYFMEHLLDIAGKIPALSKALKMISGLLALLIVADAVCYLVIDEIYLHFSIANWARFLVIVSGATGTILLMKKVGKEGWFFLAGTLILVIAGGITTYMNSYGKVMEITSDNITQTGMFYYRSGMLVQILFFAMGISYKIRQTEMRKSELEVELLKEKFEKEIEKQKAIEQTRTVIASDLHDEIGATLSSIGIYSKLAGDKIRNSTGADEPLIGKISEATQEIMNNMSDAIWSIKPENDSLDHLFIKIRSLMSELFGSRHTAFTFEHQPAGNRRISMDVKRNLYLIIREALNNIAKHSRATEVRVSIREESNRLIIEIMDNGTGFKTESLNDGNGLGNMRSRTGSLGGEFFIESIPSKGTTITATFDIAKINY